ncbi:MAG TPA: glycosyltransferase family 2 protein [Dehalococcoidia bacterium]
MGDVTTQLSSVSAFFPCYNDARTIGAMVQGAKEVLERVTTDYEIIVVNDGSTDESARVLAELAAREPRLRVVEHPRNRGYGGALKSGFAAATKEYVFYTDGDGQYDPAELALLVERMTDGVDLVNGYKLRRADGLHRVVVGRLYGWAVRQAFRLRVRDVDCDFRLFRASVFRRVGLQMDSGAICVEMIRKVQDAGFRIVEVPVHHYPRLEGGSRFFRPLPVLRTFLELAGLWWRLVVRSGADRTEPLITPVDAAAVAGDPGGPND